MTVIPFRTVAQIEEGTAAAARHVQDGGLVAYPTETVYGFGCALAPAPLARLSRLKRRDLSRPFLVLLAEAFPLPGLHWTSAATALAEAFWPGPLTLVLETEAELPPEVRAPDGTVAVRVSPHPAVRALTHAFGAPITSTSANLPGRTPATDADTAADAIRALGDESGWVLLDGGELPASPPSTIVACTERGARVVRHGAVPVDRLRQVVREIDV